MYFQSLITPINKDFKISLATNRFSLILKKGQEIGQEIVPV